MLRSLAELLLPASCPGCGRPAEPVCAECRRRIRPGPVLGVPAGLDDLVVPFAYEGVVRELVARAKYRRRHAALGWLAAAMTDALGGRAAAVDAVTFAPTTNARRRERGFDAAEVLATQVGARIGVPVRVSLRRVGGQTQTGRSRSERASAPGFLPRLALPGGCVLLVDDVVTTGATMRAAATTIRSAGARTVLGLAAARRP